MHIVHSLNEKAKGVRTDAAGHKSPPSAPPAIPPIIITPFNRQIPNPAIDPRSNPPGPPVVPPRRPDFRM
jgi:hypothetical protein